MTESEDEHLQQAVLPIGVPASVMVNRARLLPVSLGTCFINDMNGLCDIRGCINNLIKNPFVPLLFFHNSKLL